MKKLYKPAAFTALLLSVVSLTSLTRHSESSNYVSYPIPTPVAPAPKIQVAILLDVSGSMDGLLEQAKAQLWNMVNTMGKASCEGISPKVEIALYEYGRGTDELKTGYIKQINPFTNDLDEVSKNLFNLKTTGSDEYCGKVIYTSLKELKWDSLSSNYKVIFIAGNEDFLQGDLHYTKACTLAKTKGVIVNTIYCGDRMQGITEHWNLSAECGKGSFSNINQNVKEQEIPTPYDSTIFLLNNKLNKTYIYYGEQGKVNCEKQKDVDNMNTSHSNSSGLKRIAVKGNSKLYTNGGWDAVDAFIADEKCIDKMDMKTLPADMQNKTREELKKIVIEKGKERTQIQQDIAKLSAERETYIAKEKAKNALNANVATLETEMEKIIKEQAKRFNMIIQ